MNKCSILIVDDNDAERYLLRREIDQIDFIDHIFEAENGQVALDLLADYETGKKLYEEKFPPMFIFLDINMPLVDGFEFLEKFAQQKKENDYYQSIILMMFTSSERQEDRDRTLAYDFVKNYLIKGEFDHESLEQKMRNFHKESGQV